ncbi:MAG: peptidase [Bacteroidetes bacterium SW_9_63_38]|nr:MAG: peptidase [Bacteroidetes bacterium SW_9_63_38]
MRPPGLFPVLLRLVLLTIAWGGLLPSVQPVPAQTRPAPTRTESSAAPRTRFAVYEDSTFTRAVRRGTRTRTGRPGPRYWQQYAHYDLEARLHPDDQRLVGSGRITYVNRSPDTLRRVALHLRQNLFRDDTASRSNVPRTGGVTLRRLSANGRLLSKNESPGYRIDGTVAWLSLPAPLPPGDSLSLVAEWAFTVPPAPADGRHGREDNAYFLGYWYPQVAVYDDIDGWVAEPYTGQAEFYMGRADYDVRLTVPHGWLVGATGHLQNPDSVLAPRTRRRLARAQHSDSTVRVHAAGSDVNRTLRPSAAPTTWHFRAENVRDVAWGTSPNHQWDATRALVSPSTADAPDTVLVHSFYRPRPAAAAWPHAARLTRQAVESLSKALPPYPYPTMTAMEGVLDHGGMEYPMLTVMRPWADPLKLAGDLTHEVAHNWVPMHVGTNEKRHPWMDEGFTQYHTAQSLRRRYGPGPRPRGRPNDSETGQRRTYLRIARRGYEVPLSTHGDDIPRSLYFDLPYDKAAQVLRMLRELLGPSLFRTAQRTFYERWGGRHPTPYDYFNTVADVSGRDLGWFWHTWIYTTATLDQTLHSVKTSGDSTTITVTSPGRAPMPVRLALTRVDGTTTQRTLPVDPWLRDADTVRVTVPSNPPLRRVEIDPKTAFPDVNRSNQAWQAPQKCR